MIKWKSWNENSDDVWIQVEPEENVFVVNIGDMMSYFSNGVIKGRVLADSAESRWVIGGLTSNDDLAGSWNPDQSCNTSCEKFKFFKTIFMAILFRSNLGCSTFKNFTFRKFAKKYHQKEFRYSCRQGKIANKNYLSAWDYLICNSEKLAEFEKITTYGKYVSMKYDEWFGWLKHGCPDRSARFRFSNKIFINDWFLIWKRGKLLFINNGVEFISKIFIRDP